MSSRWRAITRIGEHRPIDQPPLERTLRPKRRRLRPQSPILQPPSKTRRLVCAALDTVWRGIWRAVGIVARKRDAGNSAPEEGRVVEHFRCVPDAAISSLVNELEGCGRRVANSNVVSEIDTTGMGRA
jgi:hypothetical protein